jgi:homopolymeric O-antigen transport system permease protein
MTSETTSKPPSSGHDQAGHIDATRHVGALPSVTVIEPVGRWGALDLREIWRYRELLYFLVWRDLKVRYKQTFFGFGWAVLQPFLTMVVFSIVFGRFIDVPSDGVPYPVFSYTALLPWTLFAGGIARAGNSLIQDPNLLSKIYFPRLALPLAAVSSLLLDFCIAFVILIGLMAYYGIMPGAEALAVPAFLLLAYATTIGTALWLSAANVKYRDINYVIPLLVQFWLFLTPIAYPSSLVPEAWRTVYSLNPMVGVVEGFRWALLGTGSLSAGVVLASSATTLVVLAGGLVYFRRIEHEFADVV